MSNAMDGHRIDKADDGAFGQNARGRNYPRWARCPQGGWSGGSGEVRSKMLNP